MQQCGCKLYKKSQDEKQKLAEYRKKYYRIKKMSFQNYKRSLFEE